MNKTILYIIASVCLLGILFLVFFKQTEKQFDTRITIDKKYKNPYGLYIAYNMLPSLFNNSTVKVNSESPVDWYDTDSMSDGKNVFFLISYQFNPSAEELRSLYQFVKQGNQVFICTPWMNEEATSYFGFGEESIYNYEIGRYSRDSGVVSLYQPPFNNDTSYFNPGLHYTAHFTAVDSVRYRVLGKDESGDINMVKVNAGKGSFYFNSNPALFYNYFLLYKNNIDYFQKVVSLIPPGKNKIIWDEYFVYKYGTGNGGKSRSASPLRVLFSYSAFTWAFSLLISLLLLYIATQAKRMQRLIQAMVRPKNDTLDFAKTIGRLYYEKSDHTNLARKMATYLLEHIRNKYFISTANLNEEFINNLSHKSGYDEEKVKEIVGNLVFIQAGYDVSEHQLVNIYQSFSKFYKYTS